MPVVNQASPVIDANDQESSDSGNENSASENNQGIWVQSWSDEQIKQWQIQ